MSKSPRNPAPKSAAEALASAKPRIESGAGSPAEPGPAPRRRRRKPRAQFVLFKNVCTTAVLVPRATNAVVARFQDVLLRLEPRLRARPNMASTAGWLLREGFRFASRNRVHGLGRAPEAPAEDYVSLEIHVDRRTWGDVQRWAVVEEKTLETVVPRLIELGAEQHPPLAPPRPRPASGRRRPKRAS